MINLWPHQAQAAKWMQDGILSALWWDMRTGKTLATIAGTDDGDRLIVCPNSVKAVWKGDLKLYGQESLVWGIDNFYTAPRPRNLIVNYESFWRTDLIKHKYRSIIFDESLRLQNPRTKLWNYLQENMACLRKARVVLLSGTPCPEGPHQLINQAIVATGQYCNIRDPWKALRTYFLYDDYKWTILAVHRKAARQQLSDLGPTLTQAEAGINTKKLYRRIEVPIGAHEQKLFKSMGIVEQPTRDMYLQSFASGRPIEGITEASAKLDSVAEYAQEINHQGVILVHFTASMQYLWHNLHVSCSRIWGGDAGPDYRAETIKSFTKGDIQWLICNVATVKVGLNLSAADTLIFAENSWSGECRIQAEERATAMGKSAVEIVDFCTIGCEDIDLRILEAVRAKKDYNAKAKR
jgi:hypothetical protein